MNQKSICLPARQGIKNQSGVTLLLAMFIMTSIALVSLSIGAFAIQELRSSRAVALTEPAISAAESAGEQSLWLTKRFEPNDPTYQLVNCNSGVANNALSNNTRVNACKSYDSATFNLVAGTPQVFYLYDPADMNGDIDLLAYPYTKLFVTQNSGDYSVSIKVARLDLLDIPFVTTTVNPGSMQTITIPPVSSGSEGRMMVTLTVSVGSAGVTVDTDQGMPTFPTLDVLGCSSRSPISTCDNPSQEAYMRRINISLPEE